MIKEMTLSNLVSLINDTEINEPIYFSLYHTGSDDEDWENYDEWYIAKKIDLGGWSKLVISFYGSQDTSDCLIFDISDTMLDMNARLEKAFRNFFSDFLSNGDETFYVDCPKTEHIFKVTAKVSAYYKVKGKSASEARKKLMEVPIEDLLDGVCKYEKFSITPLPEILDEDDFDDTDVLSFYDEDSEE